MTTETTTATPTTFAGLLKDIYSVYSENATYQDFIYWRDWCVNNTDTIKSLLNVLTIEQLGKYTRKDKKASMVKSVAENVLHYFNAGESLVWCPTQESYEAALARVLSTVTEEKYLTYKQQKLEKAAARKKALTNPETLEEFKTFVYVYGESQLSTEQRDRYDELMTGKIKQNKEIEAERKAQVTAVAVEGVDMLIRESIHTKKLHKIWVVQLSDRVERHIFNELNERAKKLTGYYSSFRGNGAIPGFTFPTKEAAELFVQIKDGDVNAYELRKAINADKLQQRAERLEEKADNMEAKATEELNRDRKDNTARRARIATGMEQRAAAEIEFALTMEEISKRMKDGNLVHLERLGNISQLDELENILYQCKWSYIQANDLYKKKDEIELPFELVDFAKLPYPAIHKDTHILTLLKNLSLDKGKSMAASRMLKSMFNVKDGDFIVCKDGRSLEDFERLFLWPSTHLDEWTKRRFKEMHLRYKRITSLGITTAFELRAALRELIRIKTGISLTPEQKKMQQIRELERKFIGLKIDGFFPTPETLGANLVDWAQIEPGNKISEPSAGLGHIAEIITAQFPDNELVCIEKYQPLHEALLLKGFTALNEDFLTHTEKYDRIIMNPPFENDQDIDHVLHAWSLLNEGGRIVAVMAGNKSKDKTKVTEFMEFVRNNGRHFENPSGSFESGFRPTGVNTITVILEK